MGSPPPTRFHLVGQLTRIRLSRGQPISIKCLHAKIGRTKQNPKLEMLNKCVGIFIAISHTMKWVGSSKCIPYDYDEFQIWHGENISLSLIVFSEIADSCHFSDFPGQTTQFGPWLRLSSISSSYWLSSVVISWYKMISSFLPFCYFLYICIACIA